MLYFLTEGRAVRVLLGGSWLNDNEWNLEIANRNDNHPGDRNHNVGLRASVAFTAGIPGMIIAGSVHQEVQARISCRETGRMILDKDGRCE